MGASYADRSRQVAAALVAAYRPYVEGALTRLGVDPSALAAAAVDAGAAELASRLEDWAARPAAGQRATPMELFRDALDHPTRALAALGVEAADRDEPSRLSLPGDVYDLAPASARQLGEAPLLAMVAWGIARAEAMAGVVPAAPPAPPAGVALLGSNLMDRTTVAAAAEDAGLELAVWRNPAAVAAGIRGGPPRLALVDLAHPAALDAVAHLRQAGVRVVAFGPHVDTEALAAAGGAGAEAMPRSRFFRSLPDLLRG